MELTTRCSCPAMVSILTRPEGRMQYGVCGAGPDGGRFQSSPGQKAGCNPLMVFISMACLCGFQSSPGQKAGCNSASTEMSTFRASFNPHPARRPDAIRRWPGRRCGPRCFNPHPARRPDAIRLSPQRSQEVCVFQSSPGQKAGCNGHDAISCDLLPTVSILTRPEGRMQLPLSEFPICSA